MGISLKAARVNAGLTQEMASKLLGISQTTLVSYETYKSYPKEPIVKKIVEIYGIAYKEIDFAPRK